MPTLSAMFRLMDGYSTTLNKFINSVNKAATEVLRTSKNTDGFNDSLNRTNRAASIASAGIGKLVGAVASLAAAKKTMDLTDTYTNTNARLGMITSSLSEQKALQQDIFAAANRARGSYDSMANAVAKMRMLAGESFGSNQEAIGFTELLQKSLQVSGASSGEQDSAFLQLTQAMAAGKLQGDEFRSIMENAPMVANAIAEYMGKTKGELKELSSEGAITADVIKNAMFAAADDINAKFNSMPMTFADTWTRIQNAGTQAFSGVFQKINTLLNSEGAQAALNNIIGLIYLAGDATERFIDFCTAAWPMVSPFIWAAAAALGAYVAAQGIANALSLISAARFAAQAIGVGLYALAMWATTGATWAETTAMLGLNSALYACPIVWIAGLILVLVAAFYAGVAAMNHFAGTSISATGLIGAAFFSLGAYLYNTFIYPILAAFAMLANFIGNVFNNPTAAVKILFLDMANTCVGYVLNMARAIENIINKIPGVTVDITSGLENFKSGLETKISTIKDESGWQEFVKQPELLDYTTMAAKGYNAGSNLVDKASNPLAGFNPNLDGVGDIDLSQFATSGSPATVKGTGKGGAVKVENEEDIEWMRKLAERDYVARIAQNTLAPNIRVEFTGPITKEADTDSVMTHVVEQLRDVIATAPEGVPA